MIEEFSANMLPELSPFEVLWENTTTTVATAKNGGTYEKKKIIIKNATYTNLFSVEVPKRVYEMLRILKLRGIKTFSAELGTADVKGYRPLIVTGTALYQNGDSDN